MSKFISLTIFLLLGATICNDIPQIDIFVESLCPDCQNFIADSFADYLKNPSYKELANINFIPYGNAQEIKNGDKYEFTCQHGPFECYGNTVENCALNKLSYEEGLNFMVCFESKVEKSQDGIKNALKNCISEEKVYKDILECSENEEGNILQHKSALKTPVHTYVPWVHFNGEHDKNIEDQILKNMNIYLCGFNKTLTGCEKYSNKVFLAIESEERKEISKCMNEFFLEDNFKNIKLLE